MSSSPVPDGQTNSVEPEPPIEPFDASTGIAGIPIRVKART